MEILGAGVAVTIKDVALVAGVSASTVCRALSTPQLVKPATRERVRQAAGELGYHPNRAARGLITGRTGNLGIIVPDLINPFFPGVVKGAQTRANENDYSVFLADTDEDAVAEAELVRALSKQVDGVLLCAPRMSEEDLRLLSVDKPVVILNRRAGRASSVTVDNAGGMRQAISHLTALGHKRVAYVGGPRRSWSNRERIRGLRAACAFAGVELVEIGNVSPQFEGGVAAGDLLVAAAVTAVITYNDVVALGVLNRFAARGIRVPDQISVVGIDDIAMAGMVNPPLTTIAQPKEQIGRVGVDLLLQLMEDPDRSAPARRELPLQLLVRGSTGPAPLPRRDA